MGNKVIGMKGLRTLEHTFTYKHAHIMHITRLWLRIHCGVEVCVLITAVPITKMFAWGGGGQWRTCATRDYEPRPRLLN
jgi:hypothetical protein